jgi:hypothetical protein
MQDQWQVECTGDGLVGDIIVGRANASRGDDEVVVVAHPPSGLNDLRLIVCDDFDSLEVDA